MTILHDRQGQISRVLNNLIRTQTVKCRLQLVERVDDVGRALPYGGSVDIAVYRK